MPKEVVAGKEYEVREESYDVIREDWAEYLMASGVRVRVKPQVVKLFRILDDNGQPAFTPQGDPFVIVRHQVVLVSSEARGTH